MGWFRRKKAAAKLIIEPQGRQRYFWLGGRRHVVDAPYLLPNDIQEINRLDLQHYLLRYALRGQHLAPVKYPHSVLDVGAGTGRWTLEMAAQYPQANIMGVDLVLPPVDTDKRPDNVVFTQGNILEGLAFADGNFDFVQQRMLFLALPFDRWPGVVAELARVTRQHGWVELLEAGVVQQGGPAMTQLMNWGAEVSRRRGIDLNVGNILPDFLHQARLSHVAFQKLHIPVGAYGGRIGLMMESDVFAVIAAIRGPVIATQLTSPAAYDATVEQAHAETSKGNWQGVWPVHIAYAQKV